MVNPVVLGIDKATEQEVVLSAEARRLGNYVVGIQGMGKSNLLLQIALADIANHEGVCVLTPHSELIEDILMRLPEDRWGDVIVFDPSDDKPVGLNIFEWQGPESGVSLEQIVDEVVFETFRRLWGDSWGARMEEMLSNTARTIAHCQTLPLKRRPTLTEFAKVVGRGGANDYRDFLLAHIDEHSGPEVIDDLRDYWDWLEQQTPSLRGEIASSTLNKARPFRTNRYVRHVVGQSTSPLDFRATMDEGKILLADLNAHKLGTGNVELLGSLLIGRLYLAALGRDTERDQGLRPFHIIADEFAYFATPAFAALQDQARKFAVTVLVAHQRRGQLEDETKDATKAARNWVVFNVNPDDAVELSEAFDSTPPEPEARGEQQKYALASMPWDELNRQAHENPKVVRMTHRINERIQPGIVRHVGDMQVTLVRLPEHKQVVEAQLNKFLYCCMVKDVDSAIACLDGLLDAMVLQPHLYFSYLEEKYNPPRTPVPTLEELFHRGEYSYVRIDPNIAREYKAAYQVVRTETRKLLAEFGSLIAAFPVYARGGKPITNYEPQRSFADVTEEWKNRFAHLPQYEAWCRVQEDRGLKEYHIRTIEAPNPPETGSEIAQSIRSRSSATYGRSRAEIEAEIAARMEGFGDAGDDKIPEVEIVD